MRFVVSNLNFAFSSGKPLFHELSLSLDGPALYFLRGKNGAGKSTLARILAGLLDSGEQLTGTVQLNTHTYDLSLPLAARFLCSEISYVPQRVDDTLAPRFNAQENLALSVFPQYPGLERFVPYTGLLVGIPLDIPVSTFSGGQRQLLSIVMAAHKKPSMLILDEPTSALDDTNALLVMDMVTELSTRMLCICICHDEQLMQRYPEARYINL